MSSNYPHSDIVSLVGLQLATTIGPDHWHRTRPQPIQLSIYLHLAPLYLDTSGRSDNVADSLHYGVLAKAVERRVSAGAEHGYTSVRELVNDVTDAAFEFAREVVGTDANVTAVRGVVHAIRVVLSLPKQILLAGGFQVELTTRTADWISSSVGPGEGAGAGQKNNALIVRVTDLTLPILIGVNPPERLAKQRVVTDLTFFEAVRSSTKGGEVDYPAVVQQIATEIERSTHLTLEKLVYEIIQTAYRVSDAHTHSNSDTDASRIDSITVRCRKPSAISFADGSEVEMTRTRRESS